MKAEPSVLSPLAQWVQTFSGQMDLPGVLLLVMLVGMVLLAILAQQGEDFELRRMLLDENEKPSMLRILAVGAWGVSSWVLMKDAISAGGADATLLAVYLAAWSGAPVAAKLIEALAVKWGSRGGGMP